LPEYDYSGFEIYHIAKEYMSIAMPRHKAQGAWHKENDQKAQGIGHKAQGKTNNKSFYPAPCALCLAP
jgi:hypothetical protein